MIEGQAITQERRVTRARTMPASIQLPRSPLLLRIVGFGPTRMDPNETRRALPRGNPRKIKLALRRPTGPIRVVRLHDVSKIGLSILCRERLDPGEIVGLRLDDGVGPYERFRVIHVIHAAEEFRVGLVAEA